MTDGAEILSLPARLRAHARGLLTRTRKARFRPDVKIGHVLLIAGPSGSGKSTFMDHLAAGRLPPAIASRIPEGAEAWLRMCGSRIYSEIDGGRGDHSKAAEIPGVVLHYETTLPWFSGADFAKDRGLAVLNLAQRVTVIDIRPDRATLIGHLKNRKALVHVPLMLRPAFERFLLPMARKADILAGAGNAVARLNPFGIKGRRTVLERTAFLIACYEDPHRLEEWYRRWDEFVNSLPNFESQIFVEPDPAARSFRLIGTVSETRIREAEAA